MKLIRYKTQGKKGLFDEQNSIELYQMNKKLPIKENQKQEQG